VLFLEILALVNSRQYYKSQHKDNAEVKGSIPPWKKGVKKLNLFQSFQPMEIRFVELDRTKEGN